MKQFRILTLAGLMMGLIALVAAACGSSDSDDNEARGADTTSGGSSGATTTAPALAATDVTDGGEEILNTGLIIGQTYTYNEMQESFQQSFDRSHPFQPLDTFCKRHDAPSEALSATDEGITEDEIIVVHIRSRLEQLASFGFAPEIGSPTDQFNTFANYINDECGGIYGRKIKMVLVEVDAAGAEIDELRNVACVEATEDNNAVIVVNNSGFQGSANLCLVKKAAFISAQGQNSDWVKEGNGRLISLSPNLDQNLQYMVDYLLETKVLEGKTVGIFFPDTAGQPEVVERSLKNRLEDAGINVAVYSEIGCGPRICNIGIEESVSDMIDEGVDVIFPALNVVSLPVYIQEMVDQGVEPGDVQFYNSDFNSQASELVSARMAISSEDAANLYDGTIIVDDAQTGITRNSNFELRPFNEMCMTTYTQYSESGEDYDPYNPSENSSYGAVTTACAEMRMIARAIYDAGPNPSREDIYTALKNLGSVDLNNMIPGTIAENKYDLPDSVHLLQYYANCPRGDTSIENSIGGVSSCLVSVEGDEKDLHQVIDSRLN